MMLEIEEQKLRRLPASIRLKYMKQWALQGRLFGFRKQIKYQNYHLTRHEAHRGSALRYVGVSHKQCLRHFGRRQAC